MDEVEEIWFNYRDMASSTDFTKSECSYLLTNSSFLLKATNKVVAMLEKTATVDGDKQVSKLVNLAGRQRMLSQKISVYYVAAYLELPSPEIKPNFLDAVTLFDESLISLTEEKDLNTAEINKKLVTVTRNWEFTKKSLKLDGKLKPATVTISLNNLLKDMNKITGWYAAIK